MAWFHKTQKGGRYSVGGVSFLVGADGRLFPDPTPGTPAELRLLTMASRPDGQVAQREAAPAGPVAPQPPVELTDAPKAAAPAPAAAAPAAAPAEPGQSLGLAWFHKLLRKGTYSVGGAVFTVTDMGVLIPPPGKDLYARLERNVNLELREILPHEVPSLVPPAPAKVAKAPPPPPAPGATDMTFDADFGMGMTTQNVDLKGRDVAPAAVQQAQAVASQVTLSAIAAATPEAAKPAAPLVETPVVPGAATADDFVPPVHDDPAPEAAAETAATEAPAAEPAAEAPAAPAAETAVTEAPAEAPAAPAAAETAAPEAPAADATATNQPRKGLRVALRPATGS